MSNELSTTSVMSALIDTIVKQQQSAHIDANVVREGTKIILPENMSLDSAIDALRRKKADEETEVAIAETVNAFPLDGAYALMRVLKDMFGWARPVPEMTFFGPKPPQLMTLEIGYGESTQVIWGQFAIPGVEGVIKTGMTTDSTGKPTFMLQGQVKKKSQALVKEIADKVRHYAKNFSVYRGKAIRLATDGNGHVNYANIFECVKFLDLSRVNPDELTFSDDVKNQVETSLFTPITHTELCRSHKIPLKRGVLLEGKYGTGKTLTAYVTATKCVAPENGWTFIYLDRVTALREALAFARMYQPAVVFAEDVDRVTDGARDVAMDDILNTIDGVESKGTEIITILTTNHVENIDQAMLRPGRLDAVISVAAPDAAAAEKLVRIYEKRF